MAEVTSYTGKNRKSKTIREALNSLNEASRESSDEIREMINRDYGQLRDILSKSRPHFREAFNDLGEASAEQYREAKQKVLHRTGAAIDDMDRSVHERPYFYVGATAALAALLGYMLGRNHR